MAGSDPPPACVSPGPELIHRRRPAATCRSAV